MEEEPDHAVVGGLAGSLKRRLQLAMVDLRRTNGIVGRHHLGQQAPRPTVGAAAHGSTNLYIEALRPPPDGQRAG